MRRPFRPLMTSIMVAALIGSLAAVVSAAGPASARVTALPATWTPTVTSKDATVRKMVQCGSTMFAVGSFSQVSQGGHSYTRHNAFSFSATTGAVTTWDPDVNGIVNAITLGARCFYAYLGGVFTRVGTTAVRNVVQVTTAIARVHEQFAHNANGAVETLALVRGGTELMIGGAFTSINDTPRAYLVSTSPWLGAVDSYFIADVAGRVGIDAERTLVYNMQVSPSGRHLLFEGNFTSVDGQGRLQVVQLVLGVAHATLSSWFNKDLNTGACNVAAYVRAGAYSPDEKTIYLATTGVRGTSPFCDSAVALVDSPTAPVKWINKTGTDSLYAVAAGLSDVYVGGHERWADNPDGKDSCVTTCVDRPGVGDISTTTGLATSWNPTRDRGKGADDLLITPAGLWISSDTFFNSVLCAHQFHPGICFFPGGA